MQFRIMTTIPEALAKLARLEALLPTELHIALFRAAEEGKQLGIEAVRERTPQGKSSDGEHLRDTTTGSIVPAGPSVALVRIWQTKTIRIGNEDVPLSEVLRKGRRGGYEVAGKKPAFALYWEGIQGGHPVARSRPGPANPNPYAAEAREVTIPVVAAVLRRETAAGVRAAIDEAFR